MAPQEPCQGPPLLDPAAVWAGGLVDDQDASRMDWVVWAEGFDAEEPSEVLCLVAVPARIRQLYRIEDACRELSAESRRGMPQRDAVPLLDALGRWLTEKTR